MLVNRVVQNDGTLAREGDETNPENTTPSSP
jgi:hypothetical protein